MIWTQWVTVYRLCDFTWEPTEHDPEELAGFAVFAFMGFGEFELRRRIGAYGEELAACLRRMSP